MADETKEQAMTTATIERKATPAQIDLYTRLVNEYVEVTGYDRDKADSAIAKFPKMTVTVASGRIELAMSSLKKAKAEAAAKPVQEPLFHIWPGTYTVEIDGSHRTFRVRVQPSDAKFAAGMTVIEYLAGPNNSDDFVGFGFVVGTEVRPWKRFADSADLLKFAAVLMGDPESAMRSKHCARCGEVLTVPESVRAGFGPVCVKKGLR
jgi:hypothetical protein